MKAFRLSCATIFYLCMTIMMGCESSGQLAVRSLENPDRKFTDQFSNAYYHADNLHNLEVLLFDGETNLPKSVLHMRMVWQPRVGKTPLDPRSTNVTLRLAIINESGVGIYAGAGFLRLSNVPGSNQLRASIRDASLRLQDRSEKFKDRLGLAEASGSFTADLDPVRVQRLKKQLQVSISDQLGHPRFIKINPEDI